jgi:hypothetical protein
MTPELTREDITKAAVEALEGLDYVNAVWEMGAAAFDRVDEWSDIDLMVDVEDEHVEKVLPVVEEALKKLSPVETRYELPMPTWHGHIQVFFKLRDASRFHLLDLAVMKHSSKNKFNEAEIHGEMKFHFNRNNKVVIPPLDEDEFLKKLKARLKEMGPRFKIAQNFIEKEVFRGNLIEARALYDSLCLAMLVEVLRYKYIPVHYDFKTKYIHYELPRDVVERLQDLYYVKDAGDLQRKHRMAIEWFNRVLPEIDINAIETKLRG